MKLVGYVGVALFMSSMACVRPPAVHAPMNPSEAGCDGPRDPIADAVCFVIASSEWTPPYFDYGSPAQGAAAMVWPGGDRHGSRLAQMYDIATRYDRATLEADLDRSPVLTPAAKRRFIARVEAVRPNFVAVGEQQSKRWREVYLLPAVRARRAWEQATEAQGAWLAKMNAALEATPLDAVAVAALRDSYLTECIPDRGFATCTSDPVARPATESLRAYYQAHDDHTRAVAESELMPGPSRVDPSYVEYVAIGASLARERAERAEYERALTSGTSPAELHRRWPEPPLVVEDDYPRFGVEPPRGISPPHGDLRQIDKVERGAKLATLKFRRRVEVGWQPTTCRTTNRVDHIVDGHVVYQEKCDGYNRPFDHTPTPVQVPLADAVGLRRYDVVALAVGGPTTVVVHSAAEAAAATKAVVRPALVLAVWRGTAKTTNPVVESEFPPEQRIRIRGFAVTPTKPAPAAR